MRDGRHVVYLRHQHHVPLTMRMRKKKKRRRMKMILRLQQLHPSTAWDRKMTTMMTMTFVA